MLPHGEAQRKGLTGATSKLAGIARDVFERVLCEQEANEERTLLRDVWRGPGGTRVGLTSGGASG